MIWDARQRRYEDEDGRPIPMREVRKLVDQYIADEQKQVELEAEKVVAGTLTTAAFFEFMREKISGWHAVSGVIAYGGESQMDAERWARINQKVTSELEYLANFQQEAEASFAAVEQITDKMALLYPDASAEIRPRLSKALFRAAPSEVETITSQVMADIVGETVTVPSLTELAGDLIGGQIVNRSGMYPDAAYGTFENNQMAREFDDGVRLGRRICAQDEASCDECVEAATEEFIPLDEIPEIGSLQCLSNCRCEIEFDISGVQFATSELFGGVVSGQEAYGGNVEIS